MSIQKQSYQIQGMRQDNLVATGFSSKFAHEIMNMRLNTIGDYTTASWTTEKGTKSITVQHWYNPETHINYNWITDKTTWDFGHYIHHKIEDFNPIGQAIINDNWILFGVVEDTVGPSYIGDIEHTYKRSVILRICYDNEELKGRILYWGDLGFNEEYPIETTTFYENEYLQKVYWTDGLNQPRMINIVGAEGFTNGFDSANTAQFDFIQELDLTEYLDIEKLQSSGGMFPPCTVKYALTYYKENGQESNIFLTSTLLYPIKGERGCSPDELSGDSFEITVKNITANTKNHWDYIRLYSIVRTSDNATPIVRIVDSKKLANIERPTGGGPNNYNATFIDTNSTGRIIDPNILFYIGGRDCVVGTLDQKDNVLFLGNLKFNKKSVTDLNLDLGIVDSLDASLNNPRFTDTTDASDSTKRVEFANDFTSTTSNKDLGLYPWKNQLNNTQSPKIFKYGENYRIGIQFQDKFGVWSEVLYLKDRINNNVPDVSEYWCGNFSVIKYTLPSAAIQTLKDAGYVKARLTCCYPNNANKHVIAQGVLCPTISNVRWDNNNAPNRVSSWFYRFNERENNDNRIYEGEVQSMSLRKTGRNINTYLEPSFMDSSWFHIQWDVCTFHSPDIEFDESLRTLDTSKLKLRILGKSYPTATASKVYLDYSKKAYDYLGNKADGYIDKASIVNNKYNANTINKISVDYLTDNSIWNDIDVYNSNFVRRDGDACQKDFVKSNYRLFPFQRKYLNNYMGDFNVPIARDRGKDFYDKKTESSILNSKVWSTLNFSINTRLDAIPRNQDLNESILDLQIIDSSEVISYTLKSYKYNDTTHTSEDSAKTYFGNLEAIAPLSETLKYNCEIWEYQGLYNGITTTLEGNDSEQEDTDKILTTFNGKYLTDPFLRKPYFIGRTNYSVGVASDPILMKYKSTPHLVLALNNELQYNIHEIFKGTQDDYKKSDCLLLAELYREDIPTDNINDSTNRLNDVYVPCSKSYRLPDSGSLTLINDEGDSYYMRYDSLKTYPFTNEDINQIVDIYSFMCETRINLDGRYDRNRGLVDNTIVNNTNFNLINKSYTQTDNLFSYTELDELSAKLNNFPNQITITNKKSSGEETDSWTNITLASTVDANGTYGEINKILNINNNLILFQDHGIARIKYNENTAIPTTTGEPLELAKTNRLDGFDYINTTIGCQNKWSISNTKNGLFWIDDSRQELLTYDGQSINSFSPLTGMESFMIKELPSSLVKWNPKTFNNFVTYYDKLSNDIYYINKNYCLAWNEEAKSFTSFYNYERVPYMTNLGNHSLMWKNGVWAAREANTYCSFFSQDKDYWMTIVCDGQTDKGSAFPADKVFNNIEYRADIYNLDGDNTNYAVSVFNQKHVWNGYQDSNECASDSIRKFNTWRIQLPRNAGTRDRIRNPFCYIKLLQKQSISKQTDRVILHDLAVYFDMR